ncbi:protein arginine N-methyltransferase 5 [Euwallacea similis]|uniref:protein arginine N-methyltransferase 5 n=1 Tax=Euwallacea similis TaxID=1736056 RepID=UPI00344F4C1E
MEGLDQSDEKRKRMSCGVYSDCPEDLTMALQKALDNCFHFIVTQLTHPSFIKDFEGPDAQHVIGRNDRLLKANEWGRLIVGELSTNLDVDSDVNEIKQISKEILEKELGFASHLGLPAILIDLIKPKNIQLARIINDKLISGFAYSIWVQIPLVHISRDNPMGEIEHDTWDWWNEFRTYCDYDKRVGLVLEIPDVKHLPSAEELDRWVGEPVKALVLKASYFLINQYGKPVLPKVHQEIIKRFMTIDVQYIIHLDVEGDPSLYVKYMNFLGKKLYVCDATAEFVQGCEDYLQNPLQPLTEHLESTVYEVFEKDQVKYDMYRKAFYEVLEQWSENRVPVVMVVGAGRGPLVQAVLNVSNILSKEVKVYAVEKNPYAMNTLVHRNKYEWNSEVTLVKEDMRSWQAPQLADIMISELLGSFGDNELSPECLDGAQRFLRPETGISIPHQYTSFITPVQSLKIFNEIKNNRLPDKTLRQCYETPYIVHLANYYQLGPTEELFVFNHPNFPKNGQKINNTRHKSIRFPPISKAAVLTGLAGFFETKLYGNITLSTNPKTHTPDMVSWFPIIFPLASPIHLKAGDVVRVSFWREESVDKVWYEWCLESPCKTPIMNPNGRSYSIKKH